MDSILLSSFIAGIFTTLIGYPLDTIKTRIQLNNSSALVITKNLIKNEGVLAFYKGASLPLIYGCFLNSLLFSTEHFTYKYTQNHYYSGFISGLIIGTALCPFDLIKIKFQSNATNLHFKDIYKSYINKEFQFYKALPLSFFRDSFGCSIYFGTYFYLQNSYNNPLINGGIAGAVSWIYSYPFDVIKTNQQLNNTTLLNTIKKIKYDQYYKGLGIMIARTMLTNALKFYIFENTKKIYT
jgi:solute carrier family 25 carnitine/acylcarnitine transporter 20/29